MDTNDGDRMNKKNPVSIQKVALDIAERFPDGSVNIYDEMESTLEGMGFDDETVEEFSDHLLFIDEVTAELEEIYYRN